MDSDGIGIKATLTLSILTYMTSLLYRELLDSSFGMGFTDQSSRDYRSHTRIYLPSDRLIREFPPTLWGHRLHHCIGVARLNLGSILVRELCMWISSECASGWELDYGSSGLVWGIDRDSNLLDKLGCFLVDRPGHCIRARCLCLGYKLLQELWMRRIRVSGRGDGNGSRQQKDSVGHCSRFGSVGHT